MIIPIATFVVLFTGIFGAYLLFVVQPEQRELGIVRRRLRPRQDAKSSVQRHLVKQQQALSSIGAFDRLLQRSQRHTGPLTELITQSGVKVTLGTVIAGSAALAAMTYYAAEWLTGIWWLALPAALGISRVPVSVLKFLRTRRMRKFEEQFPEALDLIGRSLRAGHAFTTGLEMVATEMPSPCGEEFRLLYDQQNYGLAFPDALKQFADRLPLLDARFFVTAVLIQRESGGNLAEVLDNLSGVIRERFRVKRQMRVASAHGRITGWVLVLLPPTLGALLMAANQEHRELMLGEALGLQMLAGAAVLQVIGTLIIRKIINIPY